jgi:hypothetical protein
MPDKKCPKCGLPIMAAGDDIGCKETDWEGCLKRQIAAKDAEIADLKRRNFKAETEGTFVVYACPEGHTCRECMAKKGVNPHDA